MISTPIGRLRAALAILLVASAALFAVATTMEKNARESESAATEESEPHAEGAEEGTTESTEGHSDEGSGGSGRESAESERLFGIDLEQPWLIGLALAVSIGLAAAALLRARRGLFVPIAAFGLAFAALDAREVAHQTGESNAGLVALAATLTVMHLAVAVTAWRARSTLVRSG